MAGQVKYTIKRGGRAPQVTIAAGSVIAGGGSDAIEVNIDYTNMTQRDALEALDQVRRVLIERPFPPL